MKIASAIALPLPKSLFRKEAYVIGPWEDWFFILLSPLVGFGLAYVLFSKVVPFSLVNFWGESQATQYGLLLNRAMIQSHIILVFFRSHLNTNIFKEHPLRFTVAPLLILALILSSDVFLVTLVVVASFWDYFHSGLQSFGISRIYDVRAGNDPHVGRGWDIALNHFIYLGAIVAGMNFFPSFMDSFSYRGKPILAWNLVGPIIQLWGPLIQNTVAVSAMAFLICYALAYLRYARRGYRFSLNKTLFLLITASVTVYSWLTIPLAFTLFIVNFYHTLQYFAIVWAKEKQNFSKRIGVDLALALPIFLMIGVGYGLAVVRFNHFRTVFCFVLLFSVLHFWYDGFVWSVRRKQI